ncbi:sugar ABC transporter ATP-binding protein [Paenibacillus mendelii]|uniref:Sugar ABC transporter ATP-binding protein n=1 Tax=Paenibacillus mendelii TaxID=206163 RepID=A0ABV6JE81_9BACL|nr:sugar ABC transporter ATP-binding protein [Paenibacillus mendelii]MCQ6560691.1 sugar ABC transporter ATP-binding protein [Paenibacillus mendelii]
MLEGNRLKMSHIAKAFSGVQVLKDVTLHLDAGRVLALLGENGAGKSTMIKILNGDYSKDAGEIFLDGVQVSLQTPSDAAKLGIRVIYQELNYVPHTSVMENIYVGHLPRKNRWFVDWKKLRQDTQRLLDLLGCRFAPDELIGNLSIADKQLVEIAKALSKEAKVLVMDEPTAALTAKEVDNLFRVIRGLKSQGVSIIYISHHLDEVTEICDDLMVMRDGEKAGEGQVQDYTTEQIVGMMVGKAVKQNFVKGTTGGMRVPVLEAKQITRAGMLNNVSFTSYKGEIVGVYGLLGSGKEELGKALFGEQAIDSGEIKLNGQALKLKSTMDAKKAKIAYVPPDRKVAGLVLDMSVKDNLTLSCMNRVSRWGFFQKEREIDTVNQWVDRLKIKLSGGIDRQIRFLSGGNQQKVILSRWLMERMDVLILCDPTMGVDVGARADIYEVLQSFRDEGLSVIVISSDLYELQTICDRVLLMKEGQLTHEFEDGRFTEETLLAAAMGGH